MSVSRQIARELVRGYDHSLEQQIMQRGSSLACRDEELWVQVEGLLRDGDAAEKHCLGVDPLEVMEESLAAAAAAPAPAATCRRRVHTRGELQGLAKAFEVLEQSALNLYLGPWRKEYRVIKMYSGAFTHRISPVLSPPQIEKLFGLLGYEPSPSWPEQLRLQGPRVSPASLDDLLRLSCAFFIARCECRLLLAALGKHVGDARWELSVVRERLRGNSLQVALENTKKTLEISQSADGELDLYGDEQVNGEQKDEPDEENRHFENKVSQSSAAQSAGASYASSPPEPNATRSISARSDTAESQQIPALGTGEPEAERSCQCLRSPLCLTHCLHCNALHDITCAFLASCEAESHRLLPSVELAPNLPGLNPPPPSAASAASSSLHPIGFHDCCDPSKPDPQVLCSSCRVFHAASCKELKACQNGHDVSRLGVCSCGKLCSRSPLVLCRYCGAEYCTNCWYKNPITCICGQTFDQSSSV